ncbi:MAG: hypothetical protein NXI10_08980 [bacterium]|nr:hypothetical protein [bacterium]
MLKSHPVKSKIRVWNTFFLGADLLLVLHHLHQFQFIWEYGFEGLSGMGIFNTICSLLVLISILVAGSLISRGKKMGLYLYIVAVPFRYYFGFFTFYFLLDLFPLGVYEIHQVPVELWLGLGILEAARLFFSVRVYHLYHPKRKNEESDLLDR